jgi:hypothetical protein
MVGKRGLSLLQSVQTGSEAFRFSYSVGMGIFSSAAKRPGHGGTNIAHLVPRLRMSGTIRPLLHTPSWRAQEQLYLYFAL